MKRKRKKECAQKQGTGIAEEYVKACQQNTSPPTQKRMPTYFRGEKQQKSKICKWKFNKKREEKSNCERYRRKKNRTNDRPLEKIDR